MLKVNLYPSPAAPQETTVAKKQVCKTSAPIGPWKCNVLPYRKLCRREKLTVPPSSQQTDMGVRKEVTLPIISNMARMIPFIQDFQKAQGVQEFFFTIHRNPSLAYIAVRDLQSSQRNASVQSLLLAGNFLYSQ